MERRSPCGEFLFVHEGFVGIIKIKQAYGQGCPRNVSSAQSILDTTFAAKIELPRSRKSGSKQS